MATSIFCQSDSTQICVLVYMNNRLMKNNEILNSELHDYFLHNLKLTKDSAEYSNRIKNLINYINENNCAGDSIRFKSYDKCIFSMDR